MKILYIITKSEIGGAQTHILQLVRGMRDRGHTVAVMSYPGGWLMAEAEKLGVKTYPNPHFDNSYNPFKALRATLLVARTVRKLSPDIVSLHSSGAGFLSRMAIRNRVPTVYTAHSFAFTDGAPMIRKIIAIIAEKIAAPFSSKIICVSEFDRLLARRYHIAPERKLVVVYNGVSVGEKPKRQPGENINIIFIGRLAYPKLTNQLVDAFASLPVELQTTATLTIIGDGPQKPSLMQQVSEYNIQDRVRFVGAVEPQSVGAYLRDADLFVLLSRHEGFPMTILEAMAAGLPVVASRVGGIPEQITTSCGMLVGNTVGEVRDAITALLSDQTRREAMGAAAYERIAQQFSVDRFLSETERVYESLRLPE